MKKLTALLLIITFSVGTVLLMPSCNKTLDVRSTSVAGELGHWKSLDDVRSGLIGIYGLLRAALVNEDGYWLRGDLRQGDFTAYSRPDLKAIIKGNLNASYPAITELSNWRRFYAVINACNLFLEKSDEALIDRRYTKLNHKVDVAQVRTLRAFTYFLMVRIWGDVPFVIHPAGDNFEKLPRTPKEEILAFCENEIRTAAPVLPYQYGTDDPQLPGKYFGYEQGRFVSTLFSKIAAYAILSHIAAWQGDYVDVAVYTKFILDNYKKAGPENTIDYVSTDDMTSPSGLFAARSYNQIIGFNFVEGHGEATTTGHIEDLTLASPYIARLHPQIYVSKDSITRIFPSTNGNDDRFGFDEFVGSSQVNVLPSNAYFTNYRGEIPIFKKIKIIKGESDDNNFAKYSSVLVFTRLEELTLLRAEALAVLSKNVTNPSQNEQYKEAITLLNTIKKNRNIIPYYAGSPEDLLTAIFQERRRELMGEGWRWWDQVRYHRIKKDNPLFNRLIADGGIYWPIPKDIRTRNHKITPNPYWTGN